MSNSTPERSEWSRLYEAAMRVKDLAPWEWMSETDVFGVQDPETGEMGFVSVMGALGEHYSVAVYLGSKGLYSFWNFQELSPGAPDETFFAMRHLQASFENRNELTPQDRDVIKSLGLKFRGRHAWPMFRSHRPGYFPWYVEAQEARLLACALEQTVDVAPRFEENPEILTPGDEESYLLRVPREEKGVLTWEDRAVSVPPPEPESISITMDAGVFEFLKTIPSSRASLEIDLFMFPARIGERGTRPYLAYMLLVVEAASGMVLGNEVLTADPTPEAMYGVIPVTVVQLLAQMSLKPREVKVRSDLLFQLMEMLAHELGFKVRQSFELPALDEARAFITQRFR
jgi:hypothetical protein